MATHGLDVNVRDHGGLNLLHCAALSGHAEATLSTLAVVDYNARDNEGHNPLHYAARSGSAAAVIALIALGLDPLNVDKWGNGLLFYARKGGIQDTINLCSDEIYCNQLFREKYLASFIPLFVADLNLQYSYPLYIAKIIGQYAAPYSKKEQSILE